MTDHAVTAQTLPRGVNMSNLIVLKITPSVAVPQNDTMTGTIPTGLDVTYIPVFAVAWHSATPKTSVAVTVTSYNFTTGQFVLTVSGAAGISAGDEVFVQFIGDQ
jgi:hypothetical protein